MAVDVGLWPKRLSRTAGLCMGVFGDAEAVPSQPVRTGTAAEATGYVDEDRNDDGAIPEKNCE